MDRRDINILISSLMIMYLCAGIIYHDNIVLCGSLWLMLRDHIPKVENFYELVVPHMTEFQFRRYFRMKRKTVNKVINKVLPNYADAIKMYNTTVPIGKQFLMTMAYLGSKSTTYHLSQLFGISEETFLRLTENVMDCLVASIEDVIQFPPPHTFRQVSRRFNEIGRFFPNVVGAIDGLHLEIQLTEERPEEEAYCNYHQWHSIHLQAVCSYDLSFIHVFAGWPGKANDGRVFKYNPLSHLLPELIPRTHRRIARTYHILGDSAYPVKLNLLTPYKEFGNNRLARRLRNYNRHLSSKRQTIERSFGLLMQRFPRLKYLNQKNLMKKINIVLACCILHNICVYEKDNLGYYLRRRKRNIARGRIFNTPTQRTQRDLNEGVQKRQLYTNIIQNFLN